MTLLDSIHPIVVLILGLIGVVALSRTARSKVAANFMRANGDRARSGAGTRSSLMHMLSSRQREIVRGAEDLMKNGEAAEAARMFEGLGLHQKAVQAFIQAKMFTEACKILEQTGAADRAGYMMGAAGEWEEALKHFSSAGLYGEAARCLEQLDRTAQAASQWERAGNPREAARCYAAAGQLERAGRLYVAAGKLDEACECFESHLGRQDALQLDQVENQILTDFLATSGTPAQNTKLRQFLSSRGQGTSKVKATQSVA